MSYDKSLLSRIIIFCSWHYLKLFALSILVFCAVIFHRVFPFLTHPVIVRGTTLDEMTVYRYKYTSRHERGGNLNIKARKIEFIYEGKKYQVIGGYDAEESEGIETKVIFNKTAPQNAAEFTFIGLIDFPVFRIAFTIWVLLTAGLYALATSDKHFSLFDIDIKKLTLKRGIVIAVILLLLPFIKHGRTLIFGKKTMGLITDEVIYCDDGRYHRAIEYGVDGEEYKCAAEGDYNDEKNMIGRTVPVIYDATKPGNACISDFNVIYQNNWNILTGIGLIFLSGWFFATRIPDDEGNMDE